MDLRNDPNTIDRLQTEGALIVSTEEGIKLAKCIGAYTYRECTSRDRVGAFGML